jgi:hypothetical protein
MIYGNFETSSEKPQRNYTLLLNAHTSIEIRNVCITVQRHLHNFKNASI